MIRIFVLILMIIPVLSYGQSNLSGIWKFDLTSSLEETSSRQKYDSLPPSIQEQLSGSFGSRVFSFDSAQVEISWTQDAATKLISGEYTFDDAAMTLNVMISGRTTRFNVISLSGTDLVLEDPVGGGVFRKLYFRKEE